MKKTILFAALLSLAVLSFAATPPAPVVSAPEVKADAKSDDVYLFAFFRNEKDGLHLAVSTDGLKWEALNGDKSFLKPTVSADKLMRDPTLQRGPDGTFQLVWTDSWHGHSIGYASSKDLIHWSEQRELQVMGDDSSARESWAPEIRYDQAKEEYLIYWSSSTGQNDFKTYSSTTKDFKTLTPAKVFFDPGYSEIDATLLADNGKYYLFCKHGGIGIQIATADNLQGPYKDTGQQFANPGSDQWEGPWVMKIGDDYIAYVDHFKSRDRMGAWRSHNLKQWEDITAQTSGLRGISHGSVVKVPKSLVEAIKAATAASDAATSPAATTSPADLTSTPPSTTSAK